MSIAEVKRRVKLSRWVEIIRACQSSGESVESWCQKHSVKKYSYYYWLRIIRQEMLNTHSPECAIVKVPDAVLVQPSETSECHKAILLNHHGTSVELPVEYDVKSLSELLKELAQ